MKKRKRILLIAVSAMILYIILYLSPAFSLSFKSSDVNPEFPIPANGERVEKPQAKKGWTFYEIRPPLSGKQFDRYLREIEKQGWKQMDQMGRMHVFEKEGMIMQAVLYPDKVSLLLKSR